VQKYTTKTQGTGICSFAYFLAGKMGFYVCNGTGIHKPKKTTENGNGIKIWVVGWAMGFVFWDLVMTWAGEWE
jgi:hypothetical protein